MEISLVYVSVASHFMTDDELKALIETCRTLNAQKNITGMLLYRDGYFIQALEGEESAVIALYEKITTDPRHTKCLIVHRQEIAKRYFSRWAMGFNNIHRADFDLFPALTDFMDHPFETAMFAQDPNKALALLMSFRDHNTF